VKVLIVHNRYRTSAPSGEDAAVDNERRMLERHGVEVRVFDRCNDDISASGWSGQCQLALNTVWSRRSRAELSVLLQRNRPDVVHVHNTFALISPSIYSACRGAGVPVVQTLHNFRLFCPSALFLRDGKPCEACVDSGLLQAVRYRCYRGSRSATATLAGMLAVHRVLGTYADHIDRYIALTQFARQKVIRAGLPEDKVTVKPNFLPDPPSPGQGSGGYVVFVGRLLAGKGAETLVRAWRELPEVPLRIVGDGALREPLETLARREAPSVEFLGRLPREAVLRTIADARLLVIPSDCYEGFPMVVAEAFACGTPILASRIGSLEELIHEGKTGATFPAGDAPALAAQVRRLLADAPQLAAMRLKARATFEAELTESRNFERLMRIYTDLVRLPEPRPAVASG
jgi:glycosyltransferase involved in cell wall biosynthesis